MSLKENYASRYLCTPLDIVVTFNDIVTENVNLEDTSLVDPTPIVQYSYQLKRFIERETSIVKGYIKPVYGNVPTITPFAGLPIANKNNSSPSSTLMGISSVGSGAVTELWTLSFTSTTEFDVSGEYSGTQGSGDINSKFTSTNTDIVIDPTVDTGIWQGTFSAEDKIYFGTYNVDSILSEITAMLATADAIDSLFYSEVPNENNYARTLRNTATAYLKRLQRPHDTQKGGIALPSGLPSRDLSPIQVEYDITDGGFDETDYAADETGTYEE